MACTAAGGASCSVSATTDLLAGVLAGPVCPPSTGVLFDSQPAHKVEVASLISNDILTPSAVYTGSGAGGGSWTPGAGSPLCPSGHFEGGGFPCEMDPMTGESGPWNYAQVGVVIGSAMGKGAHKRTPSHF